MASQRRRGAPAALRVRVEEARGLLPLSDAPKGDAPLLVTLRLAPGETKHSARTRAVRRGLEPVRVAPLRESLRLYWPLPRCAWRVRRRR